MKLMSYLRKYAGTGVACMALMIAQITSSQFSIIFYQDEIPEKLIKRN